MTLGAGAVRIAKEVDEESGQETEDDRGDVLLKEQRRGRQDDDGNEEQPTLRRETNFRHCGWYAKREPMGRSVASGPNRVQTRT